MPCATGWIASVLAAAVLVGWSAPVRAAEQPAPGDEHLIVDCKIPGQIRKLGRSATFLTPRRILRTSQRDCEIRGGEYVLRDPASYASALAMWRPLAESGEARAQLYVGEIFEAGVNGDPDFARARTWYARAAEQGYAAALVNLAQLYEQGLGGPRDTDKALDLYARAAASGDGADGAAAGGFVPASEAPPTPAAVVAEAAALTAERERLAEERAELQAAQEAIREAREKLRRERRQRDVVTGTADTAAEREATIAKQREELAALRAELAELEGERTRAAERPEPPRIELIDPKLPSGQTRGGPPVVTTRANIETRTVVGKVVPADGLAALLVNARKRPWQAGGVFTVSLPVPAAGTDVDVLAVDRWGRKASLGFRLQPEAVAIPETEAAERDRVTDKLLPVDIDFGGYHALVIGNNAYRALPRLQTAINDARAVAELLERRYGFEVTLLADASRYEILSALNRLRETLTENDNLLVYYAGHGELDRRNMRGHWLPVDAEPDSTANWISNVAITDILNVMAAKHVMVIADSCYSGTLTRRALSWLKPGMSTEKRRSWLRATARSHTRIALTSGGLQPVLDSVGGKHSIFAKALIEVLRANRGIIEGNQLFREISAAVTWTADRHAVEQVPQYAPLRHAGHEGGDFLFVPTEPS
jgi:uncharacterized caspase-like protein